MTAEKMDQARHRERVPQQHRQHAVLWQQSQQKVHPASPGCSCVGGDSCSGDIADMPDPNTQSRHQLLAECRTRRRLQGETFRVSGGDARADFGGTSPAGVARYLSSSGVPSCRVGAGLAACWRRRWRGRIEEGQGTGRTRGGVSARRKAQSARQVALLDLGSDSRILRGGRGGRA